ncbi:actin family [Limtongia smithiae]|uniref:actin family n=1 Tax=Limtongia smithiae TaxID=1125753 RepID=UPI0034CE4C8E
MAPPAQPKDTFVIDNGAYEIKAGFARQNTPVQFQNCVARGHDRRGYIGDQLSTQCNDYSGLIVRRPFEKGHLTNWESENAIWNRLLFSLDAKDTKQSSFVVNPSEAALIVTEPLLHLPTCSANLDQMIFEEYCFASSYRCPASLLAIENNLNNIIIDPEGAGKRPTANPDTVLVVDSGYSATTVTPIVNHKIYTPGIRRVNVGGKLLRNFLAETISFRHYNMMDESYIVNEIKDKCGFISQQFLTDLRTCKELDMAENPLALEYVLPRTSTNGYLQGHIRDTTQRVNPDDQILKLSNERFSIPELLFNPSDVGFHQAGIPETIMQSVSAIEDQDIRGLLLGNVIFLGGCTQFPGFKERISTELQSCVPEDICLRLGFPESPTTYAWQGGAKLGGQRSKLRGLQVTRKDYLEYGENICIKKYASNYLDNIPGH